MVGLTLDENGIPKSADKRFELAKKILDKALEYGIRKEDVYIDCLTLTASAEQENVMQTVNAVERVKNELGLKTVLGVSNISFGLPSREIVNHNFLMMALTKGLDLPIMNPNIDSMTATVRAYKLLTNIDKNSVDFISHYGGEKKTAPAATGAKAEIDLPYAIENGLKKEAADLTAKLLQETEAMNIVNDMLIPALDKAGAEFEKGKLFLPQLIQTAGTAQACFEVIKNYILSTGEKSVSKGKIILATVKGDIHDIGKNLVALMLKNYGFQVIDLGKDVPKEEIIEAAIEHNAQIIALSALMTTTMQEMRNVVEYAKEKGVTAKIMIGGAVITQDYADEIHADGYSRDAADAVRLAKRLVGMQE